MSNYFEEKNNYLFALSMNKILTYLAKGILYCGLFFISLFVVLFLVYFLIVPQLNQGYNYGELGVQESLPMNGELDYDSGMMLNCSLKAEVNLSDVLELVYTANVELLYSADIQTQMINVNVTSTIITVNNKDNISFINQGPSTCLITCNSLY